MLRAEHQEQSTKSRAPRAEHRALAEDDDEVSDEDDERVRKIAGRNNQPATQPARTATQPPLRPAAAS